MSVIKSGATTDELVIDPVSKAARVTLYNPDGTEVSKVKPNQFYLPFNLPISVAIAANSYLWAIRNGGTKKMTINDLLLTCSFHGTAAASTQLFELVRFSGTNPSGGTAFVLGASIPRKDTTAANSTLQDGRYNGAAALVVTGLAFDAQGVVQFGVTRSVTNQSQLQWVDKLDIVLQPNEGLALRATNATVVGDNVLGNVHWTEE